jgi:hypothetical protein
MIYHGTAKGNVVVLEPGAEIPDGTPVHVETTEQARGGSLTGESDPFRMGEQAVETGIADLATNADHHLYGQTMGLGGLRLLRRDGRREDC